MNAHMIGKLYGENLYYTLLEQRQAEGVQQANYMLAYSHKLLSVCTPLG